jgi:RNA polymerase-binding protein DksA
MRTEDVAQFRNRLVEMRKRLTHTVNDIGEAISEDIVAPGDVSTGPTHSADMDASDVDENVALAANEAQLLVDVEAALERIEQGKFGQCQRCGKEIGRERLAALPYAPLCIQCARTVESESAPERAPRGPVTAGGGPRD